MDRWKSNSKEHGQSLVEFALSLTILLILVVGVFDVARALFTYLSMRDAAQEGALFASFEPANTTAIVERTCAASSMLEVLDCQAIADCAGSCDISVDVNLSGAACMETEGGVQNDVEVVVSYDHFPLTMPLIGQIVGADGNYSIPIRASIIDTIIAPDCE
jgi:Flp pilus assembly protein TadG